MNKKNTKKYFWRLVLLGFLLSFGFVSVAWALSVTTYSPADNATGVSPSANLQMTFDANVQHYMGGTLDIKDAGNGNTIESFALAGGSPSVRITGWNGATLTIDPTNNLQASTSYYIHYSSFGIREYNTSNMPPGISDSTTWNFTTSSGGGTPTDWLGSAWTYRIPININASYVNGTVSNFPVYVNLNGMPASFFDNCLVNGKDLRVTKSDGTTEVAREVVWLNRTSNAGELHFVANGSLTNSSNGVFYLYYGNGTASEPAANATYGKYNVWANSFVGVWHMQENPTSTVYNSASSSYNCTGTGSGQTRVSGAGGLSGNGSNFGGSGYLSCGDVTQLNSVTKFTIAGWAKRNSTSAPTTIVSKTTGYNGITNQFRDNAYFYAYIDGSNFGYYNNNDTNWHHLVMIYNGNLSGNSNRLIFYKDSTATTLSYTGTIPATGINLAGYSVWIGRDDMLAGYSNGKIDEVRISSVSRTGSWTKTEYNNQNSPRTFSTIGSQYSKTSVYTMSFSPADNATSVSTSANLIITFDRKVDTQTGSITIKKLSDNSTVQTISVNGAYVTGNGTTQLTINPPSDLSPSTSFYVNIASGAINDTGANAYAGISSNGTWNFTTAAAAPTDWLGSAWTYRIKLEINKSQVNGTVTNFPVYVNLNGMPASFFDNCLVNGKDLRVTKSDGTTQVAREVVWLNRTSNAGELHFVANGSLTNSSNGVFYLYYGNGTASEPAASATYGKNNVWANNYAGVWHLNEDPDLSNYLESTSNRYNGTPMNLSGDNPATGKVGYSVDFDGSNEYISTADITDMDAQSKLTLSFWGKRSSGSGILIISKRDSSSSAIEIINYSDTNNYFPLSNGGSDYHGLYSSADTSWHFYAGVFNGNLAQASRYLAYQDGVYTAYTSGPTSFPATTANLSNSFKIGRRDSYLTYTSGNIDEVRIAKVSRNGSWIKTEYNNQNSPATFYSVSSQYSMSTPVVASYSPTDNSTAVSVSANLVITFDRKVDTQTGSITIKKSSDNSTVQTISVNGAYVTGNGTTQLTINPPSDLSPSNGYYLNIASGAINDTGGNSYAGISDTTTWNFTTVCANSRPGDWYDCSWAKRIKITIDDSKVNGSVTNFPIYVNLNGMPASFFDNVLANGADLRVTKSNGITEIAREVVWLNRTSNAGELHFVANGTLTNSSNSDFYLYYNNSAATEPAASATYGKNNVWVNSYAGVWHMNEDPDGGASSILDSTSSGTSGTPQNLSGTDPVDCQVGRCLNFTGGSSQGLRFGDVLDSTTTGSSAKFTASYWMKPSSTSGVQFLVGKYTDGSAGGTADLRSWGSYTNSGVSNFLFGNSSSSLAVYATSVSPSTSAWTYITNTYDATSATLATRVNTYTDGVVRATTLTQYGTATYITDKSNNMGVGYAVDASNNLQYPSSGRLDEIRISSVVRNGSWIKTEYNNQNSPSTFYRTSTFEDYLDVTAPTVSSFSPTDNATGVSTSANLVITFSEAVDTQTGSITIKKSSDNSTVQTISVNGAYVTGNGTTQLTINPPSDLSFGTGYYVNIASGAIKDASANSYAGISDTTTWNFTTVAWYNTGWSRRVPITVNGDLVNGSVSNFPVYVNLNGMPAAFFDYCLANGADLRVTKSDGSTEVAREVVWLNRTSNAGELHFVANGSLTTSDTTYYVYYGNGDATEPAASATYGKNNVWANNYVGVWHMNDNPDGGANSITNSASSSYSGTPSNLSQSQDSVDCFLGKCFNFDGSSEIVSTGTGVTGLQLTSYTYSFWMKRSALWSGSEQHMVNNWYDSGSAWYGTLVGFSTSDNTIRVFNGIGSSSYSPLFTNTVFSSTSTWHYINATYDATTMKVYVNNLLENSLTRGLAYSSANQQSRIGGVGLTGSSCCYFPGLLDEVRISNTARNGSWIKTEYNNQNSPRSFISYGSVTLSDTVPPSVSSLSPSDGSTTVATSSNLVMNFDKSVTYGTMGSIFLKKSSDNSTIETFPIGSMAGGPSARVSGWGTSTITIDPTSDLSAGTGCYIQIDSTAIKDTGGNSYAGISDTTTWNFTTAANNQWFNSAWSKRLKLVIDDAKVNGTVLNFPVYVNLANLSSSNFFNVARSDGGDIRITQGDGLTELPYELVKFDSTNNLGELHFKAPHLSNTSNADFYIYYGNSSARPYNATHALGANAVWSNGFVAVYHLAQNPNNDASNAIINSVANRYHGTSSGSMTSSNLIAGQVGNGLSFDGSNDYISTADINGMDAQSKLTLSFWGKRSTNSSVLVVSKRDSSSSAIEIINYSDTLNYFPLSNGGGDYYGAYSSADTNWHFYVGVFNGNLAQASRYLAYQDGVYTAYTSGPTSFPATTANLSNSFKIGRRDSYLTYTSGSIDEVRVAKASRNGSWIKTEYNNQSSPSTFYRIDSTVGTNGDSSNPQIASLYPANQSTKFPIRANLKMTFNETVTTSTGNIYIYRANGNTLLETISIGSMNVTGSGTNTIVINPTSNLPANRTIYVLIDSGSLLDGSSNVFGGISIPSGWRFTTEGAVSNTNMFQMGF